MAERRSWRIGTAACVAAGVVAGFASPAGATTFSFDGTTGTLTASAAYLQPQCTSLTVQFVQQGQPNEDSGVACSSVHILKLDGTGSPDTMSLASLNEDDFPSDAYVVAVGSPARDVVNDDTFQRRLPLGASLGAGNDFLNLDHGEARNVEADLGANDDAVTLVMEPAPAPSAAQIVDGSSGTDRADVGLEGPHMLAYPVPGGWSLYDFDGDSYAELDHFEAMELRHYLSNWNIGYFEVVPSMTQPLTYRMPAYIPDRIVVDTRGLPFAEAQTSDGTTFVGVQGFQSIGFTLIRDYFDPIFYIYNGRVNRMIDAAYDLFLGRAPDDSGFAFWEQHLFDGDFSRQYFVASLQRLPEHAGLSVDLLYDQILHRAPDAGGRAFWQQQVQNGSTLDGLRMRMYGSQEYFDAAGGTNDTFLQHVYSDILGRPIDPSGQQYWGGRLANGENRQDLAAAMLGLPEPVGVAIARIYDRLLGRTPGPAEIDGWRNLWRTQGEFAFAAALAGSDEFYTRVAPLDPAQTPAYIPDFDQPATATAAADGAPVPPSAVRADHPVHAYEG